MKEGKKKYYQQVLEQELARRQHTNPRYSLRSFARYLEIDSSTMSAVMRGRRALPLSRAQVFASKLALAGETLQKFIQSCEVEYAQLSNLDKKEEGDDVRALKLDDDLDTRILVYWEYFAIYAFLGTCPEETGVTAATIAERMFMEEEVTVLFLDDLCLKGLVIKKDDGLYYKVTGYLHAREIAGNFELFREAHRSNIHLLTDRLNSFKPDESVWASSTISVDAKKLPQVRKLILEFQKKLSAFLREGEANQVYQFMAYFFPISKKTDEA